MLERAQVLLLGEMHGTAEFPAFVAALSCHAEARGPVIVALELPRSLQPALDAFVHTPREATSHALFTTGMWAASYQDGRTSVAMKTLIEQLAAQKSAGAPLSLLAIDEPDHPDRDEAMAAQLARAHAGKPEALVIALVGNVHNRLLVGVPWDEHYRPLGYQLTSAGVPAMSLHGTYEAGTAWNCETPDVASCGVKPLESPEPARPRSITLATSPGDAAVHGTFHMGPATSPSDGAVHGTFHVGPVSASPPACATWPHACGS